MLLEINLNFIETGLTVSMSQFIFKYVNTNSLDNQLILNKIILDRQLIKNKFHLPNSKFKKIQVPANLDRFVYVFSRKRSPLVSAHPLGTE